MATAIISAVLSVVGTALGPFKNSLLEKWAASQNLGTNVKDLKIELLAVKAVLEYTDGKEIADDSAFKELLVMLQDLSYDAEDVLDELDYFRIKDELHGTSDTADKHPKGSARNLALTVQHTARAVGRGIGFGWATDPGARRMEHNTISSAPHANQASRPEVNADGSMEKLTSRAWDTIHYVGKYFPCSYLPCVRGDDDATNRSETIMHNSLQRNHDQYNSDDYFFHDTQLSPQRPVRAPISQIPPTATTQSSNMRRSFFVEDSMLASPERNQANETPKLRFDRVDASKRIQDIIEQLRIVHQKVSDMIKVLGPNGITVTNIACSRPNTNSFIIEPKLFGRGPIMNSIIHDITKGKHSDEVLTVILIVGPGGIGKTTLVQHIYQSPEVQKHFHIKVWICVSLNFNANRLIEQIEKSITKVDGESGTAGDLIGQRLKAKRFFLVLDDMWDCRNADEWKQLLVPFKKLQLNGNIILVTTRFPAQANIVKTIGDPINLQGLDNEELEDLFLAFVFPDEQSRKGHTSLLKTGKEIVQRLKGSPLAAKTVGRLLNTQLDLDHWISILESKAWEQSNDKDDIMPALKLSYDYLPSHLQRCFSYSALFPQDYKFKREELIHLWIGLDVLHPSHGENKRVEDIGLSHLTQLVNHGFFKKELRKDGTSCYIIHDLLHELGRKVSSHECLSIDSSQPPMLKSLQVVPSSIRHLSINVDDTSVKDRLTLGKCVEYFKTFDKILKVEKLRSLMIFGEHHSSFVRTFADMFKKAKVLRVVFLSKASYEVEDVLQNFYNLFHLRYLRIQSSSLVQTKFPNKLSIFYHMLVLDAKNCDVIDLQRDMSNLAKLRHFVVQNDVTHSSIVDVGKLKSLQEVRKFVVKKEIQGFELRQIGQLVELRGSLCISDIENIQAKEEAEEAQLMQKNRLHELILCWNIDQSTNNSTLEEHVIERLVPSSNLQKLSIKGHGGSTCPSWLGRDLLVESLEYLCLDGVAWKTFPPIGHFWLINEPYEEISGTTPDKRFGNLRRLELLNIPWLKKWTIHAPCQLFPFLEVLAIRGCSELEELSFSHFSCCQQRKGVCANVFPRLLELNIGNCPQLVSFPPIPWTEALCSTEVEGIGSSCLRRLVYARNSSSEYSLTIEGKDILDNTFSNVLAFHNLTRLKELRMLSCQPFTLHELQMLSSLRTLRMPCLINDFPFGEGDSHVKYEFPVELLTIDGCSGSGKELTQLLSYFPKLSDLRLSKCEKIVWLSVTGQQATAPVASTSNNLNEQHQPQDQRVEEEIFTFAAEGLLLLPPQLQELHIIDCPELRILNSVNDNKGEGLHGLRFLQQLNIMNCPKLLSSYLSSSFSSLFPFPNCLQYLRLEGPVGMETLEPLSNLSSLTSLYIAGCGNLLTGEGLLSLVTQGHLTKLYAAETPNFCLDTVPSWVHEKDFQPRPSKLQELSIDHAVAVTTTPICGLLFSSLTTLNIFEDQEVDVFTKEQEDLLFTDSLEEISFMLCGRLQYLPAQLHSLPNLKRLYIWECEAIQKLPEKGLPSSLQELVITGCPKIRSPCKNCIPSSLQKLVIKSCPSIRSLPMLDDLPSSLHELDVRDSRSEGLRTQCRKLIGTIPIVRV